MQDPSVTNEIRSGIDRVLLIWMFNDGDIQLTEISDLNADGSYDIELDTSTSGIYYFFPIAIDIAGNIQYIDKNGDEFSVEVVSSSTSTTTTTSTASLSIIFTLISLISMTILWKMNRIKLKKRIIDRFV